MKDRHNKTLKIPNPWYFISNFYGNPTSEYGKWIESLFKDPMKMREKYQSLFPERKKAVRKCYSSRNEIYSVDYSLWLEEKILEKI